MYINVEVCVVHQGLPQASAFDNFDNFISFVPVTSQGFPLLQKLFIFDPVHFDPFPRGVHHYFEPTTCLY